MSTWWANARLTGWAVVFGVVIGLLAGGVVYLVSSSPRGEPIQLSPPPSPPPLIIHVSGAVARPGVYSLPMGSRLQDAITAAGGFLSEADPEGLNLAAPLEDGALIKIPTRTVSQALPTQPATAGSKSNPGAATATPADRLIHINTATLEELDTLPGIGPVIAQRIIDYRTTYGPFASIESIQAVSGIGPAKFESIKDLITITDNP